MNFDDLRKDWQADKNEDQDLSINLSKKREASTAIDLIRKYMRQEFWVNLILTIVFLGLFGFFIYAENLKIFTILVLSIYILATTMIWIHYYSQYWKFYHKTYNLEFNSLENLLWFSYEMKLNMMSYRSTTFHSMIIGFGGAMIYTGLERGDHYTLRLNDLLNGTTAVDIGPIIFFAIYFGLLLFAAYAFGRLVIRRYEKQIRRIDQSIAYLKEFEE